MVDGESSRHHAGRSAMWQEHVGWISISALAVVILSIVMDRRRMKRHNLDAVGFMPWAMITLLALFVALATGIAALKG